MRTTSLAEDQPGLVHARLLFVGEGSLQMNMLKNLISEKFNLPVDCVPANTLSSTSGFYQADTLIILDCLSMSAEEMVSVFEQLDENRPPCVVLLNMEKGSFFETLAGWPHVAGMLQSNLSPGLAINGFSQILLGGLWLPRNVMEKLILGNGRKQPQQPKLKTTDAGLTKRETQILMKLAEGTSNTQIADALFLSEHTVKTHLYNLYRKVKVKNRTQASNWLKQHSDSLDTPD